MPISWICKKQTAVSHGGTEAEIMSLDAGQRYLHLFNENISTSSPQQEVTLGTLIKALSDFIPVTRCHPTQKHPTPVLKCSCLKTMRRSPNDHRRQECPCASLCLERSVLIWIGWLRESIWRHTHFQSLREHERTNCGHAHQGVINHISVERLDATCSYCCHAK